MIIVQLVIAILTLVGNTSSLPSENAANDTIEVTLMENGDETSISGRLILKILRMTGGQWDHPIPSNPDPLYLIRQIASVEIEEWQPGETRTIPVNTMLHYPESIDKLTGEIHIQCQFKQSESTESLYQYNDDGSIKIITTNIDSNQADRLSFELSRPARTLKSHKNTNHLKWIELRSKLLSEFYSRDVFHRAGVALPNGYHDETMAEKHWPVIYMIPGFGNHYNSAPAYASMLKHDDPEFVPQAIYVILDPAGPLGHHGFVDSANNGPRAKAMIEELIPHLSAQFRMSEDRNQHALQGHGLGGWAAIWLQLHYPDQFGGCWALAPDPVSFARFRMSNLYKDSTLYSYAPQVPSNKTPSYQIVDFEERSVIYRHVEEDARIEYVMNPTGQSGQRWDTWEAMFSLRDDATGLPQPMFDSITGVIYQDVVEHWKQYDIYHLLGSNWDEHRPTLDDKIRILAGEYDNYFQQRAVEHLLEMVTLRRDDSWDGPGYIEIVPLASHHNLAELAAIRVNQEIMSHFREKETDHMNGSGPDGTQDDDS